MDLPQFTAVLKKLAEALSHAAKAQAQGKADAGKRLEEAFRLTEQFDWPGFVTELKNACDHDRTTREAALQSRREKLLLAARAAGEPYDDSTRAVRIGIFHVGFEGESALASIGGIEVERTKEANGERIFQRLQELRRQLEQVPFHREAFFKQVKAAHTACRQAGAPDDFVSIRDLHRELVLERARASEAFRKHPDPKNVPPYPIHQFIFDLARFIQKGVGVGEERLVTTTPSMRESVRTVFIPNLDHPLGNETSAARLAVKRHT